MVESSWNYVAREYHLEDYYGSGRRRGLSREDAEDGHYGTCCTMSLNCRRESCRISSQKRITMGLYYKRRSSWDFITEEDHRGTSSQKRITMDLNYRRGLSWDFIIEEDHHGSTLWNWIVVGLRRRRGLLWSFIAEEDHQGNRRRRSL